MHAPRGRPRRDGAMPVTERQANNKPSRRIRGSVEPTAADRQRIRGVLGDCLQAEITALERARSVVDCLAAAMEAGAASPQGPYYPDVARAASQMMARTIVTLSDLLLDSP
jgi:hypothetical protein